MARIVLGSYMVRYPLGGMMSWVLQYLVGFQRLGHEVYFVEKAGYLNACYDPVGDVMTDDPSYGAAAVEALLETFDLHRNWCFVDVHGGYHGLSREEIANVFASADLFVDMGTHGSWLEEAAATQLTVLIDGEPGFTQMKRAAQLAEGRTPAEYDRYITTGPNIGTGSSSAPTAGERWSHIFHPVVTELFPSDPPPPNAPFTTVMNWQSYSPLEWMGQTFGHKDVEFVKFIDLPGRTDAVLEVAVSGSNTPRDRLREAGWRLRDAHEVTRSFESFRDYVSGSCGEFSVCKNGYVATNSGWFSDRAAAYLATGRPVVCQDTGFSEHLPCGEGLFAVDTVEAAASAIAEICSDYKRHSDGARELARDYLDARKVLGRFLDEIGI